MILPGKTCFQDIKINLNLLFLGLDYSEVLSSDFLGLKTSAASITSVTSTASMASMTWTASFHQKIYWSWWYDHPWHPNDQYQYPFVEWINKNPIFHLNWQSFCWMLVRPVLCYFFKNWLLCLKISNLRIPKPPSNKIWLAYFCLPELI